jgi:HEAT repeat protein
MRSFWTSLVVALALAVATPAPAKPSIRALVTELRSAPETKTRVRAALELGKSGDSKARRPLEQALDAPRAAVRAAAAAGLRTLGDERAIPALKRHEGDSSAAVRSQVAATLAALQKQKSDTRADVSKPTALVKLGRLTAGKSGASAAQVSEMREATRQKLGALSGTLVLRDEDDAKEEAKRRRIPAFLITGCIKSVDETKDGDTLVVATKVEFIVHTVPDEAIVGIVAGSASARTAAEDADDEPRMASLRSEVLGAAIDSALKRAPDAIKAAMQ